MSYHSLQLLKLPKLKHSCWPIPHAWQDQQPVCACSTCSTAEAKEKETAQSQEKTEEARRSRLKLKEFDWKVFLSVEKLSLFALTFEHRSWGSWVDSESLRWALHASLWDLRSLRCRLMLESERFEAEKLPFCCLKDNISQLLEHVCPLKKWWRMQWHLSLRQQSCLKSLKCQDLKFEKELPWTQALLTSAHLCMSQTMPGTCQSVFRGNRAVLRQQESTWWQHAKASARNLNDLSLMLVQDIEFYVKWWIIYYQASNLYE